MKVIRFVSYILAVAILLFIILTLDVDEVWRALQDTDVPTIAGVLLLNLPVLLLFVLRSLLVLRKLGHSLAWRVLVPASVLGNVAGALTPAAAGEFLRAAALERSAGVPFDDGVALVVYERLLSTYLLVLSTAAFIALESLPASPGLALAGLCLMTMLAPWAAAVFFIRRLPESAAVAGAGLAARVRHYVLTTAGRVRSLLVDGGLYFAWTGLTLVSFALLALQFHLVAESISQRLSLPDAWITFGGSGVAIIASFLPFGLGIGDGSMAAILNRTGINLEASAAVVVLVRAAIMLPQVALASVSYLYLERSPPDESGPQLRESA